MKTPFYRIVTIVAGLALLLDGLALAEFFFHPLAGDYNFHSLLYRAVTVLGLVPLTLLVAFLIMKRVPGNVVGPLLIVWSGSVAYNSIPEEIGPVMFGLYYTYDLLFGWFGLFLMLLHFPDGKMRPSAGGRLIYRLLPFNLLNNSLTFLSTQPLQIPSRAENFYYQPVLMPYSGLILGAGILLFMPILVMTPISFVLRYRNGSLLERQQIKWLALFGGILVIYTLSIGIVYPLLTGGEVMSPGRDLFGEFFYLSAGLFPPLVIGISVLRYRLWDIDRIIRRTLIYSILMAILVLIYLGSVLILQRAFSFLFQLSSNNLAIVLSTLAIVILFAPLRTRIQRAIDRHFFRQKYNSDQILFSFTATVRTEVMLEPLASALLSNVEETLHPDKVSLWLVSKGENETTRRFL